MSKNHTCKTFLAKSKVPTYVHAFQIGLVYSQFRAKFDLLSSVE